MNRTIGRERGPEAGLAFRLPDLADAPVGVAVLSLSTAAADPRVTFWNARMQEITGVTPEKAQQLNWYEAMYRDPGLRAEARNDQQSLRPGESHRVEVQLQRPDGELLPAHIVTTAQHGKAGGRTLLAWVEPLSPLGGHNDNLEHRRSRESPIEADTMALVRENERLRREIRERKETEAALRENRRILTTLFGNLPGMVFRCQNDSKWTMEFVSQGSLTLTGYAADGLLWNRMVAYAELIHPEDRGLVWDTIQSALSGRRPYSITYRIRTRDGEEKWVLENGVGVFSAEDTLVALEGFITDITQRRRSTEQLSLLLESLPIVPYSCQSHMPFTTIYVSGSIREVTGFAADQFTGSPSFWIDHIHMEDRQRVLRGKQALLQSGRHRHEYRFRCMSGEYRWFDDTCRVVENSEGKPSYVVGTWKDITEEKRLRQESENRLQLVNRADKLASLGTVVAGVAHEISNPNAFITSSIPVLEETWALFEPLVLRSVEENAITEIYGVAVEELVEDMKELMRATKVGSDRINRIVEVLKDFARDSVSKFEPIDINKALSNTMMIVGAQLRKSVGKIELSLADDLPTLMGDFQKIEQVLANLIVNAGQAVPERESGKVRISTRNLPRGAVFIEVEDNGVGMDLTVAKRVFDPFYTTRREAGGTGLGLAVSYEIIEEHNGVIAVLSRPGVGTRFGVILPVCAQLKPDLTPMILIMDDDEEFLSQVRTELAEIEMMSFEARLKPERVIDHLDRSPEIDMLLIKALYPASGTVQLMRCIKERFPLLPIVLYASEDPALDESAPGGLGPDYIIPKPTTATALTSLVRSVPRQIL